MEMLDPAVSCQNSATAAFGILSRLQTESQRPKMPMLCLYGDFKTQQQHTKVQPINVLDPFDDKEKPGFVV